MAVGKKPVLTSSTALLFSFIYTLSVFCGHRTSCDSLPESKWNLKLLVREGAVAPLVEKNLNANLAAILLLKVVAT